MDAEIESPHTNITEATTTTSRHYFYRKATQPDLTNTVFLNVAESSDDFESRVTRFIQKDALQETLVRLRQDATVDLARRKADRKARKEKERSEDTKQRQEYYPPRTGPLFEKLNTLSPTEQGQWLANIHDEAMLMNPHQWLKLASLFNVNSKASRQKTLIDIGSHQDVLKDRNMDMDSFSQLENYMELRDVQNRNYARDAVAEGVKYIKQNRIKEAMDYYKRALDMDPKYADGWFHVAEGLVQQRKLQEAAAQLEKALKLDPEHEGAKALLASIQYTTKTNKIEKGDEWDLVDESGNGLSSSAAASAAATKLDKNSVDEDDDEKSSKKKKKSSSSSYRSHRSSRRSSRSPDSRHRSRESRHRRDYDSKRRDRRSSPDSRRHRRSHRSRSRDSERTSRHDDRRSHHRRDDDSSPSESRRRSRRDDPSPKDSRRHTKRDDSSPSESRRRSRRDSRDRESKYKSEKRRHRSRSPSKSQSKRKRSDDSKSQKE